MLTQRSRFDSWVSWFWLAKAVDQLNGRKLATDTAKREKDSLQLSGLSRRISGRFHLNIYIKYIKYINIINKQINK